MPKLDIEDLRFSSSSIDDFFSGRPAPRAHVAANGRIRVANTHQLTGFQLVASDTLIRVSQQDFWKLGQDEEGYFIERLVDDTEHPVKG